LQSKAQLHLLAVAVAKDRVFVEEAFFWVVFCKFNLLEFSLYATAGFFPAGGE
jgi:hypothetical protein